MSVILPGEVRRYIDETCSLTSASNLTEAVSKGEIDLQVLKKYLAAAQSGQTIEFTKTKPIPLLMKEFIAANPGEMPLKLLYIGADRGYWTIADVEQWVENSMTLSSARKSSVPRGVYLTRKRRTVQRIARVSDQFAPKIAMDVVCSHSICDGAKACLSALMGLAGKSGEVVTYTSSLATLLGRTPRTVRNYFIQLQAAGLILRAPGKSPNTVRIVILPLAKPEPYVEPRDITAYKLARTSPDPDLRTLAESLVALSWQRHCEDLRLNEGRKQISAFNPKSKESIQKDVSTGREVDHRSRFTGPTTHSTFTPAMKTDRNSWRTGTSGRSSPPLLEYGIGPTGLSESNPSQLSCNPATATFYGSALPRTIPWYR